MLTFYFIVITILPLARPFANTLLELNLFEIDMRSRIRERPAKSEKEYC